MNSPDFDKPIEVSVEDMPYASLYIRWCQDTVGFGELSIGKCEDGTVICSNEGMGKEWCRRALYAAVDALLDKAKFE